MVKKDGDPSINGQTIQRKIRHWLQQTGVWIQTHSRQAVKGLTVLWRCVVQTGRTAIESLKNRWSDARRHGSATRRPSVPHDEDATLSSETVRFNLNDRAVESSISEQTISVDAIRKTAAEIKQPAVDRLPKKPVRHKTPPIRRRSRQKVYRLKGYTTVAKINRKYQMESQQRFLRQLLLMIGILLTLILLFELYNPIRDLSEWYRIIGIPDLGLSGTETITQATGN